jgi:hypothetical protein
MARVPIVVAVAEDKIWLERFLWLLTSLPGSQLDCLHTACLSFTVVCLWLVAKPWTRIAASPFLQHSLSVQSFDTNFVFARPAVK